MIVGVPINNLKKVLCWSDCWNTGTDEKYECDYDTYNRYNLTNAIEFPRTLEQEQLFTSKIKKLELQNK